MPAPFKVACLGCSWTEGISLDNKPMPHESTYPYILSNWLKDRGNNNIMYNAGRAAAGVEYYHLVADYLIKQFNPEVFIIQITTYDRSILALEPIDENEKRLNFGYDIYNNTYNKIWDNNKSLMHLSPGLGANASKHSDETKWDGLLDKIYNERIKGIMAPEVELDSLKNSIALWWEQSRDSDYQKYFYYSNLYSLINYLEEQEKIVIPFYWLKYKPEFRTRLFPIRQYPSVEGFLGKKEFKSLTIDDGFHFGKEGHTKLVQEFLGPLIQETM